MNDPLRPAERLLLDLGIGSSQDIDLEAIAWMLGAAVNYRPLDKCEAMIVGGDRHAIITVNSNAIPARRRFSVAHEIGHWHHHRGRLLFCGPRDIGNPEYEALNPEKQADQFASDLILPNFMVRPRVMRMQRLTLAAVREIADEFRVSDTATLLKIVHLNHFPILAVCHNKMRRRWFRRARMIPAWWFPRDELDHESFAFDLLFGTASESSYPRKVGGDAWFDFQGVDRFEILEQSFRLPNEEVLTLLILTDDAMG